MADRFTVSVAQLKPHLGDVGANLAKYEEAIQEARGQGADLVEGADAAEDRERALPSRECREPWVPPLPEAARWVFPKLYSP